jgi:ABC-type multidrug transport system fused ATPase/permease subunit
MKVEIKKDYVNLHVVIEAETSPVVKAVLIFFNLCTVGIVVLALADWLLGLFVIGMLLMGLFGWLTLWFGYGKEKLIINTKSISYQYQYGFYTTKLETRPIKRALNISLAPSRDRNGLEYFNLIFETFNKYDVPEEIYRSALSITRSEFAVLKRSVRALYFEKVDYEYLKQPYILN